MFGNLKYLTIIVVSQLVVFLILFETTNSQFYNITKNVWEDEYAKGKWSYITNVAVERARNALISTFVETYGGINSILKREKGQQSNEDITSTLTILDVGCGEGNSYHCFALSLI